MSIVVALGKKVKTIFGGSALLNFFEKRFLKKYGDDNLAPIFIIGLPRSGSTLLFQVLTSNYKFSFFSNLANVFYKGSSLVLSIFKKQHRKFKLERFDSDYGYTKGFFSPSEGGSIYRDWFGENKKPDKERINKTIDAYTKIVKAPFIFKNLNASFHLEAITEIFPNAFFILINRDLRFVCQSIYHTTIHGEGINIDGLTREELLENKDPLGELAIRLKSFDKEIKEKLSENTSNYLQVDYSDLCSSPQKVLEDINSADKKNSSLEKRDKIKTFSKFPESKKVKLSQEEWEKLNKIFDHKK
jgi:hypothetical protein